MRLKDELGKLWYIVNYRVCDFFWSDLELPTEILQVKHEDRSTHVYLEVTIYDEIVIVDPTRDSWLSKIMHINQWDWISNTNIAVHPIKLYSLEESNKIMNSTSEDDVQNDLSVNKDFYDAINKRFSLQRVM